VEAKLTVDFMYIYSLSPYAQQGGTQIPALHPAGTRAFREIARRQVTVGRKGMLLIYRFLHLLYCASV